MALTSLQQQVVQFVQEYTEGLGYEEGVTKDDLLQVCSELNLPKTLEKLLLEGYLEQDEAGRYHLADVDGSPDDDSPQADACSEDDASLLMDGNRGMTASDDVGEASGDGQFNPADGVASVEEMLKQHLGDAAIGSASGSGSFRPLMDALKKKSDLALSKFEDLLGAALKMTPPENAARVQKDFRWLRRRYGLMKAKGYNPDGDWTFSPEVERAMRRCRERYALGTNASVSQLLSLCSRQLPEYKAALRSVLSQIKRIQKARALERQERMRVQAERLAVMKQKREAMRKRRSIKLSLQFKAAVLKRLVSPTE